jgi:DNA repair exonuclease SbcCD ATPase subunit
MKRAAATSSPVKSQKKRSLRPPVELRRRAERLIGMRNEHRRRLEKLNKRLADLEKYLVLAVPVTDALRILSEQLFELVLGSIQSRMTMALQDVLEQPIEFRATADFKRGTAVVEFSIERDGHTEDIRRGQGGSVQNVLSVGLRMFAVATLNPTGHRGFLVLDEQDCWLRPELVPKLVDIVSQFARELGFQVLMISHHDIGLFDRYAERVFRLIPQGSSVSVCEYGPPALQPDVSDRDRGDITIQDA